MKDFIKEAQKAALGPKNVKSQPDTPDGSRAKNVTRGPKRSAGPLKADLKDSQSRFKGDKSDSRKGIGGSSAGLKNQSKATLKMQGGDPQKNKIRILETSAPPANMIGGRSTGPKKQMVDYTRKGRSGHKNSIASLERRQKLDRTIR